MYNSKNKPYIEQGYNNRKDYLESLADEYGVPLDTVFALAQVLGPSEDFDGLVIELQDIADAQLFDEGDF